MACVASPDLISIESVSLGIYPHCEAIFTGDAFLILIEERSGGIVDVQVGVRKDVEVLRHC